MSNQEQPYYRVHREQNGTFIVLRYAKHLDGKWRGQMVGAYGFAREADAQAKADYMNRFHGAFHGAQA